MKYVILALFALSAFLGACDDPEADPDFRASCEVANVVNIFGSPDYVPEQPPAEETEERLCELIEQCKKAKGTPKPDCIVVGTVTSCTCGGIVCRGDSVTETYSCA